MLFLNPGKYSTKHDFYKQTHSKLGTRYFKTQWMKCKTHETSVTAYAVIRMSLIS